MTANKFFMVVETGPGVSSTKKICKTREEAQKWCDYLNRGERLATVEFVVEEIDLDALETLDNV